MNGDYQSVAPAPLDLSTTNRGRRSAGSTPDCPSRNAGATGGSPAPPACAGTDSLEEKCLAARSVAVSAASDSHKRPADRSASELPFRKRRFLVEPETQRPSPSPLQRGDRFSPAEDKTLPGLTERVGIAPVTPRRLEGQGPDGYSICFLHPLSYGKHWWPTLILISLYNTLQIYCLNFSVLYKFWKYLTPKQKITPLGY